MSPQLNKALQFVITTNKQKNQRTIRSGKICSFDTFPKAHNYYYDMNSMCSCSIFVLPLDMNVRSKFKLSQAASNLVKYSFLWSPCANFNAVKSGMVRVAKTSLFLYKSKVTPLALDCNNNQSHKVNTTKIYCENCIIAVIISFDGCTFLFIIIVVAVCCYRCRLLSDFDSP